MRFWRLPATLLACLSLAACVEAGDEIKARALTARAVVPAGSARGANVAFYTIDGPPAPVVAKFSALLASAAAVREIAVSDLPQARYFVRGYLTAYQVEDGTAVGYVWDVFDADKRHAKRVDDVLVVKGKAGDSWSVVGEAALASLADRSADDLAAFLAATPEAIAAAKAAPQPLAYAPAQ